MNSRIVRAAGLAVLAALVPACEGTVNNDDPTFVVTERISIGADGQEANEASHTPAMSANGRYVAFASLASNLHPEDADSVSDIYVRDLVARTTILVSRATGAAGVKGNGASFNPSISADGRYVAFDTLSDNLDPADPGGNLQSDIYVRDVFNDVTLLVSRDTGVAGAKLMDSTSTPGISSNGQFVAFTRTTSPGQIWIRDLLNSTTLGTALTNGAQHACVSSDGLLVAYTLQTASPEVRGDNLVTPSTTVISHAFGSATAGNAGSQRPAMSADGLFVAFESSASNLLAPGLDSNNTQDIFLWNRGSGVITRVSLANAGVQSSGMSFNPSPSSDASIVAFSSQAPNLVNGDTNQVQDVFVRDTVAGTTIRASVRTFGGEANGTSFLPSLSGDGRFVAFESQATNLVGGDNNNSADIFLRGPLR